MLNTATSNDSHAITVSRRDFDLAEDEEDELAVAAVGEDAPSSSDEADAEGTDSDDAAAEAQDASTVEAGNAGRCMESDATASCPNSLCSSSLSSPRRLLLLPLLPLRCGTSGEPSTLLLPLLPSLLMRQ
jgi:hypothetical protein